MTLGAISMFGSDSMGMGRVNEVVARCWQLASKMRDQRGPLDGEPVAGADNARIPEISRQVHDQRGPGLRHRSRGGAAWRPGKMADIVLWKPAFFGLKPQTVIKGGFTTFAAIGDAAASIGHADPVLERPAWGMSGRAPIVHRDDIRPLLVDRGGSGWPAGSGEAPHGDRTDPPALQGRHAPQRRPAGDPRRSADLRGDGRWRGGLVRTG